MALSERERNIGVIVAAAAVLYVAWTAVISPYLDKRQQVIDGIATANEQMSDDAETFSRQHRLRAEWAAIQKGGLKTDQSAAESEALHAVLAWAQPTGVTLASLRPERASKQGPFQVVSFDVSVTGPMRAISKLLWAVETPSVPMRVDSLRIKSAKDGTDELTADLTLSTICMPPAVPAKPTVVPAAAPAASGGGS